MFYINYAISINYLQYLVNCTNYARLEERERERQRDYLQQKRAGDSS